MDHRLAETEAGKKFLTTLRHHHEEDDVEIKRGQKSYPNDAGDTKHNLKEMRSKLEGLLVAYLTNLSPGGEQLISEHNGHLSENTRKKRDNFASSDKNRVNTISENNNELDGNDVAIDLSDSVSDASNKTSAIKLEKKKRVQIGVRNDTVVNSTEQNSNEKSQHSNNTIAQSAQNECNLRNQRITVLDRYDLNSSMQRETNSEHNIRLLLNYR